MLLGFLVDVNQAEHWKCAEKNDFPPLEGNRSQNLFEGGDLGSSLRAEGTMRSLKQAYGREMFLMESVSGMEETGQTASY